MIDLLLYIGCGLAAGLLGGYLGLGGGVLMVPYLVVLGGQNIKVAVPVSIAAITVNSLASSTEYLKKGMVDLHLVVTLSIFLTVGNVIGSMLIAVMPRDPLQLLFTAVLLYTAVVFIKGKSTQAAAAGRMSGGNRTPVVVLLSFGAGVLGGLVGVGGGVVMVPALFLILGLELTTSRGTAAFMMGFSAAASTVYLMLSGQIDYGIAGPVIFGILLGGKIGGLMGTVSKPFTVRLVFFLVLIYMAVRLGWDPIERILQ